jgi:2'-5' RNA ligase
LRIFIAINFPSSIKDTIANTAMDLKLHCLSGNFSQKNNYHITLAFIGEVAQKFVQKTIAAIDNIDFYPFEINICGFGKFKKGTEAIYWMGMKKTPELTRLQKDIADSLLENSIDIDTKSFKPHITLARRAVVKDDFEEKEFAATVPEIKFTADNFSLMRSDRINGKLIYTEIYKKAAETRGNKL